MKLIKWLRELIFVPRCVFCHKVLDTGDVCPQCVGDLPYHTGLIKSGEFFSSCASSFYYKDMVRPSILRFKFKGRRAYARTYCRYLADTIKRELAGKYDVITWAPVSHWRLRNRGYDQSELLARRTAELLGEKAVKLLKKVRHTQPNSGLKGRDRRNANVNGAYAVKRGASVAGLRILVIDDIYTTGATLSECARTLLMAGAEDVVCATVAVSPGVRKQ